MNEIIERIPLDQISPHPHNRPIGGFDQAKLEQLAESIKAIGVQQPAVVRRKDEGYELVAGERRWRASRIAGLDYLPCVVRDLDDATALKIMIVENLQREDVHPLDEADGYDRLRQEGGYDPDLIAQEVGRSLSYVYQRLRLLKLIPEARDLLLRDDIQVAHAVLLARLGEDQQESILNGFLLKWRIDQGVRVHELANWIQNNILLELSNAAWKLTDATLIKTAGACSTCPKRTGSDPALFDDMKSDHCTDSDCFNAKQKAIIAKNRGSADLVVMENYGPSVKGALRKYEWEECKKKDEGAVRCMIIDGDSPGRLTWGRQKNPPNASRSAPVKSTTVPDAETSTQDPEEDQDDPEGETEDEAAERIQEEQRQKRIEAKRITNKRLFDMILEKVSVQALENPAMILRPIVLDALQEGYSFEEIAEYHGWENDVDEETEDSLKEKVAAELEKLSPESLISILVENLIFAAKNVQAWGIEIHQNLVPWLELFQIDPNTILAEARKELGVPIEDDEAVEEEDDE